jgi:hypothetical protein
MYVQFSITLRGGFELDSRPSNPTMLDARFGPGHGGMSP